MGSFSVREFTIVAFLDIEGAFNNVTSDSILNALSILDVDCGIQRLIRDLLTNRRVSGTLGSASLQRFVSRGTPQGGVLSPLLWNLAMNRLLLSLEETKIKVVAYADDVAIAARGKFPSTLRDIIQRSLRSIEMWAKENGLGVNPEKTEVVIFSGKKKRPEVRPISLGGMIIPFGDRAKYLGVLLDMKLDFKLNLEERAKRLLWRFTPVKTRLGNNGV